MSLEAGAPVTGRPGGVAASPSTGLVQWLRDSVIEPVLSVLFPPRCVGCGDFETHLCARCEASLQAIDSDCCPRCGEPGPRPLVAGRCSHCIGLELAYAGARSAFVHSGVAKQMVLEFKSGGQPVLAPLMGRLADPVFTEMLERAAADGPVAVTWVPSHAASKRERGYNQAELLARALAAAAPQPLLVAGLARKPVKTKHQKELGRAARLGNLRGAFIFDAGAFRSLPFQPAALVLVDDVYTTGATTQELSAVLASGTGCRIYAFTFSRAVATGSERHD